MEPTRKIRATMSNTAHLRIIKHKTIGSSQDPLHCYEGSIVYGTTKCEVDATIMAFDPACRESTTSLVNQLNSINNQYVIKVLLFVEGKKDYLAFPSFQETFESYIEKESTEIVDRGRLSGKFIELTRQAIMGLQTLHGLGYYCPNFKGQHVAVMCECGQLVVKFWNFCVAETLEATCGDWTRLADKIELAAINQGINSREIKDLCGKMRNGELIGPQALEHAALLNADEKFRKIQAVYLYAEVYCKTKERHPYQADPKKSKIHDDLVNFLKKNSSWISNTPQWITTVNKSRRRPTTAGKDGSAFVFEIRSMIEYRDHYKPPDTEDSSGELESDLEYEFRKAWEEDILTILNFATDLELKY